MRNHDYENVPRTLALTTGLWTLAVAAGTRAQVFSRLPDGALMALAILAAAFAVSAVTLDVRVRSWFEQRGALSLRLAMLGIAGLMVATGTGLARAHPAGLGAAPWAPILLLGVPMTAALLVAAVRAALREKAGAGRAPESASSLLLGRR